VFGLYRAARLISYLIAFVWGFVFAYELFHAVIPHHHTLVVVGTILLGLVFFAILEVIFSYVIEVAFAALFRWRGPEQVPEGLPNLGDRWTHRSG
jgi:hypothetical protein